MSRKDNFEKYVDEYLNNLLQDEEVKRMEHRLETDPDFARQFGIELTPAKDWRTRTVNPLEEAIDSYDSHLINQRKLRRVWTTFVLATSFLIVVLVGYTIFTGESKTDLIFTQNFTQHQVPILTTENLKTKDINEHVEWGMIHYKEGKYEKAINSLEKAKANTEEQALLVDFYLGVAHLAQDKPDTKTAIQYLDKVADKENDYKHEAYWYMSLANIKADNLKEAKAYLSIIAKNDKHYKQKQAIDLLEKLD